MTGTHAGEQRGSWVAGLSTASAARAPAQGSDRRGSSTRWDIRYEELPVAAIRPNPRQPREAFDEEALGELITSLSQVGLLQPVVVRPCDNSAVDSPEYELVAGERRLRAARALGWDTVPAMVRPTEDADLLRDALLENVHRASLNPLEEAAAYQQLLADFGCTQEQLAARVGRSRPQIANTIRLLRLPPAVQRRVAAGVLSQGHARALLALPDDAAMDALAARIVAEGLSVRSVEEIVSVGGHAPKPRSRRPRRTSTNEGLQSVADSLSDALDTRVHVAMGRSKGRVTIEFAGVEDLTRILDVLQVPSGAAT
ncbi:MAG: ParB/RepB/Spo0J family partition protein [Candidatus Nanopelagicales bacterium]